jgi:hypothetical protein
MPARGPLERHAQEVGGRPAFPFAGADHPLVLTGAAGGHQHQDEGAFGRGEGENLRRVPHHDAARVGGREMEESVVVFCWIARFALRPQVRNWAFRRDHSQQRRRRPF